MLKRIGESNFLFMRGVAQDRCFFAQTVQSTLSIATTKRNGKVKATATEAASDLKETTETKMHVLLLAYLL